MSRQLLSFSPAFLRRRAGGNPPELITNGTFDTDTTGWVKATAFGSGSMAVVSGQLVMSSTGYYSVGTSISTEIGADYIVTFDFEYVDATGTVYVTNSASGTAAFETVSFTSTQSGSLPFTATAGITYVFLQVNAGGVRSAKWDNISAKLSPS